MSTHDPKYCKHCGRHIHRKGRTGEAWESVQYCTRACAVRDRHAEYVGLCAHCGGKIPRRNLSRADYKRRKYCSQECRLASTIALTTRDDMETCECGAPVTRTLWVLQLTASGTYIDAPLYLCHACAAEVGDAADAPRKLEDESPSFGWEPGEHLYHHTAGWSFRRTHTD